MVKHFNSENFEAKLETINESNPADRKDEIGTSDVVCNLTASSIFLIISYMFSSLLGLLMLSVEIYLKKRVKIMKVNII